MQKFLTWGDGAVVDFRHLGKRTKEVLKWRA
jgi:hypothetical protein